MKSKIEIETGSVVLVGGGQCNLDVLRHDIEDARCVVAADGGARVLLEIGCRPDLVIGDMDSLDDATRAQLPAHTLCVIAEQDSTDFEKCLSRIAAPLVIGHGFLGKRVDHELAAMTVLLRFPERRCILVGEEDVVALCPPRVSLPLSSGTRVSLYPLAQVTGRSTGLRWPIDGLELAPWDRVGTSNIADADTVVLSMDAPGMLLILPVALHLALQQALLCATDAWPVRA